MNEFEKQWLKKLQNALQKIGREDIYRTLMQDGENDDSGLRIKKLMQILEQELSPQQRQEVLCACACHSAKDNIEHIREDYVQNHDLKRAHALYQKAFEKFIREYKNLTDEELQYLINHQIGSAGILEGNVITITKIPKEFSRFLQTKDEAEKPYLACHCPLVRDMLKSENKPLPLEYCCCAAGFCQDIWEYILQKPVKAEMVESVLSGGTACKMKLYL